MEARPSGTMILDLDEALATEQTRLEVKRCYPHVGNALIRSHPVEDGQPHGNVIHLLAMCSREYMDPSEDSQRYWDEVMERWVHSLFYKLGNCMKTFNRRQRQTGGTELYFERLELELQNRSYTLAFALDSNSGIDAQAAAVATACRNALVRGELGEGVTRVELPSQESLLMQQEAGKLARVERLELEEQRRREEEAERLESEEQRRREADENFLASPEEQIEEERQALQSYQERMESFEFPPADFAVDYRFWEVVAPDGSRRQYDSQEKRFVESCREVASGVQQPGLAQDSEEACDDAE